MKIQYRIACLVAYFLFLTNFIRPEVTWDESVYIGIGKYLYSAGSSGIYEAFRPIVLPLILGGMWGIGIDPIIPGKILIALIATMNAVMVWKIATYYVDEKTSVVSAIVYATMPVVFVHSVMLYTGVMAAFFSLAAFLFYLQQRSFQFGLVSGLAFLTRFPSALVFVACVTAALLCRKTKFVMISSSVFCAVISLYFFKNSHFDSSIFGPFVDAVAHQRNPVFSEPWYFYIVQMAKNSVVLLACPIGIAALLKQRREKWASIGLLLVAIIPFLYFSSVTNKQPRFMIPFLPFFVLLAAVASDFGKTWQRYVAVCAISLSFVLAIVGAHSNYYGYLPTEELCNGTIITSVPMYAAYYDNLFIPAYFSPVDAIDRFKSHEANACMFIYMDVFPCEKLQAADCESNKAILRGLFEKYPIVARNRVTIHSRAPTVLFGAY